MAEGGMLAWKVQKLNVAPTLSYKSIHKTLPAAPKGKRWNFDPANKEWSLVDKEPPACCIVDVDAVVITESVSMDETSEKATMRKINDDPLTLYVEHYITPEDTFQGICLRYKIKPFELRRANGFTGENLKLMNNPLKIPRRDAIAERVIDSSRHMTQSEVIMVLLKECKGMKRTEATAYLMLSDWDLAEALENARGDGF